MVIIHLSKLEALHFSKLMKPLCDELEIMAKVEIRDNNPIEDLQMNACAQIRSQVAAQLFHVTEQELIKEQKNYNKRFLKMQNERNNN